MEGGKGARNRSWGRGKCSNPTLYGCGLCSPTHCSCVLPDSVDPDTASSVRAITNWRCEMIYSPHGPVMYVEANIPLGSMFASIE
jgi:hypothetical protein